MTKVGENAHARIEQVAEIENKIMDVIYSRSTPKDIKDLERSQLLVDTLHECVKLLYDSIHAEVRLERRIIRLERKINGEEED